MERPFLLLLLLFLSFSVASFKYVLVQKPLPRSDALTHCRSDYTDLAPISSSHDVTLMMRLDKNISSFKWIGLEKVSTDKMKWRWSGGAEATTFFWAQGQPDNTEGKDSVVVQGDKWYNAIGRLSFNFFCFRVVVVAEQKSWVEALEHCRRQNQDLASISSQTEMLLVQKEMQKNDLVEELVWIGLRFTGGSWRWVDRQILHYHAWGRGGWPHCPGIQRECGALKRRSMEQYQTAVLDQETSGSGPSPTSVHESEWETRDCEEKHHFICY